jgi:F-BAR domain only protein
LPWQRIVESTESLAQSHESLAQKIEIDAETPLRQFASKNREMQALSTIQGNLGSIAKDFEAAQKKADKLKDKTGRISSARAANANSSADDANQQWDTQAPSIFEQLQTLDEVRVNHLRDVLTQFQTHEVDSIEQNRRPAELCLNALLSIETADEIKAFVTRISTEPRPAAMPRRQSSASSNIARLGSPGGGVAPPMPPPPGPTGDRASQTPGFSNEPGQVGFSPGTCAFHSLSKPSNQISAPKETPKKHGLKSRLGTVMGRRKNAASAAAPPPVPSAEKARKDRNRSSLMPFRRGDSSKSQPGGEFASVTNRNPTPAISEETTQPRESSMRRPDTASHSSNMTDTVVQQQRMYTGSAMVNGTHPMGNHADAAGVGAPVNQNPSDNGLTPEQVISSRSSMQFSLLTSGSHYTNSV